MMQFLQIVILPPGLNFILILMGFLLWQWRPLVGKALVGIALLSLWGFSTPFFAQRLIDGLQYRYAALTESQLIEDKNASIVVLEAGVNLLSPEYAMLPIVSENTLLRLRYSAFLHKKIKAPVLVSGNDLNHVDINQTDVMAQALQDYFQVQTKWKEDRGYNTAREGIYTAEILKRAGVKKLYLVTAAYHMPRSVNAFKNKGLEVIPAPTGFISIEPPEPLIAFLPATKALTVTANALHEYIGLIWYQLYYHV